MSILHLMQCTNLGGMEQVAFRVMDLLATEDGFKFRIATPRPFGAGVEQVRRFDPQARDFAYRGRFGWRDFLSFRRHVRELAVGCSHIWVTGTCSASLAAIAGIDRPRVLSHQYHHFEGRFSWLRWRSFYDLLCRPLDAITYPTAFTRNEALKIAPWLSGRAQVVPIGFDVHYRGEQDRLEKRHAARAGLGLPQDALIVGNAGWLIRRKRFDVFLQTAAMIRRERPDALFVICGGGSEEAALKELARDLGLADAVRFEGWIKDLAPYYQAWDVLLFNSDFDALGGTPLEAAGQGTLVAASVNYGGLGEFMEDGVTGAFIDCHDAAALAKAVLRLASDEAHAQRMRDGAAAKLKRAYNPTLSTDFFRQFFKGPVP